jgi:hypothetical protein
MSRVIIFPKPPSSFEAALDSSLAIDYPIGPAPC